MVKKNDSLTLQQIHSSKKKKKLTVLKIMASCSRARSRGRKVLYKVILTPNYAQRNYFALVKDTSCANCGIVRNVEP